jgi:glutathione S-transferase
MGPRTGRPSDLSEYQKGLAAAPRILQALDRLVGGNGFLVSDAVTLADIHLAPMMSYFISADDGFDLLRQCDRLHDWWSKISSRRMFLDTKPTLPGPKV